MTSRTDDDDVRLHIETEHGGKFSCFIKNIIFGGVDGVITTFAIITASYAADLNIKTILILGLSNVLADGFSMGFGDYASSYSERESYISEREKEVYEYDQNKSSEIDELIDLYKAKGLNQTDAESIVNILVKDENKNIFIDHMMLLELNMCDPDSHSKIMNKAFTTVLSFYVFGFIPLFTYIVAKMMSVQNRHIVFSYTCIVCGITLFIIGALSSYITKQSLLKGGLITLTNGTTASVLAYFIGYSLNKILT